MNNLVHFSIRVSQTTKRKLEKQAKAEGHCSTSVIVRRALSGYLANQTPAREPLVQGAVRV